MANGKLGDHPLTDILNHHAPVYSPEADALIAEIVELSGRGPAESLLISLGILWAPRLVTAEAEATSRVDVPPDRMIDATAKLQSRKADLIRQAESKGWDMASIEERLVEARSAALKAWA